MRTRRVVVLPAPFGPSMPTTWLRSTVKSTVDTATKPSAYSLRSPRTTSGTSACSATTVRCRRRRRRRATTTATRSPTARTATSAPRTYRHTMSGVTIGVLAGYLRDGRTGEARQRTGRGERRQRSRVARGRVGRRLRRAGQHDAGRFTRPGVRGNREAGGDEAVAARVDARDARVRERTGRRAALADQVVVQPLRGQEVQPVGVGLRAAAAVVPAGGPGHAP